MDAYPGVPKRSRSGSKSGSKYGPETYFIAENAGEPAAGRPPSLLFGRRNRFKNPFFFPPSILFISAAEETCRDYDRERYYIVRTAADPI